jgi:hypothetical protein
MKFRIEDIEEKLEISFGRLTPQARNNALDFLDNYDLLKNGIITGSITITASAHQLASKLKSPEFTVYRVYLGSALIMALSALVFLFIDWRVSSILVIISILLRLFSNYKKNLMAKEFCFNLRLKIIDYNHEEASNGMYDLIKYYIAGIIMLTGRISVITPRNPSDCMIHN